LESHLINSPGRNIFSIWIIIKKYTDFNRTLPLHPEKQEMELAEKIEVRDYAHPIFQKSFDFLRWKDPKTYFEISTLGQELTQAIYKVSPCLNKRLEVLKNFYQKRSNVGKFHNKMHIKSCDTIENFHDIR